MQVGMWNVSTGRGCSRICSIHVGKVSFAVICLPKYRPGGGPKRRSAFLGRQTYPVKVSPDCIVF
jgi:hypothetical protein